MLKKIFYFMLMIAAAMVIAVGGYQIIDMLNHEEWSTMIIYILEEAYMLWGFYFSTSRFVSLFNKNEK